MPLITCPDCGKQISDQAPSCPNCGRPVAPPRQPTSAYVVKKSETFGVGCLVQALSLAIGFVIGLLGGVVGIFLGLAVALAGLVWGSQLAVMWSCGNCKNKLAGRDVRVCPACNARLFRNKKQWETEAATARTASSQS
jgi:rRNA maturation endonuclease Nob1